MGLWDLPLWGLISVPRLWGAGCRLLLFLPRRPSSASVQWAIVERARFTFLDLHLFPGALTTLGKVLLHSCPWDDTAGRQDLNLHSPSPNPVP